MAELGLAVDCPLVLIARIIKPPEPAQGQAGIVPRYAFLGRHRARQTYPPPVGGRLPPPRAGRAGQDTDSLIDQVCSPVRLDRRVAPGSPGIAGRRPPPPPAGRPPSVPRRSDARFQRWYPVSPAGQTARMSLHRATGPPGSGVVASGRSRAGIFRRRHRVHRPVPRRS